MLSITTLNSRAGKIIDTKLSSNEENNWYTGYNKAVSIFTNVHTEIVNVEERTNLINGVLASYVLPVLFAATGAVAFVVRAISEQIRDTMFSQTAPIRHLMRVALGILAGVIVGLFNGLSAQLSVPPLAVAFLAGYGVEAVFSMFDGIIANFRQARTGT